MNITYWDAVLDLVNNTEISGPVNGPITEYTFHNNQTPPTEEQIQAKIAELQAEYEANQYQRDRAADYPSWQEQMDLLYHGGVDALKAELKKTKDKFPKPS